MFGIFADLISRADNREALCGPADKAVKVVEHRFGEATVLAQAAVAKTDLIEFRLHGQCAKSSREGVMQSRVRRGGANRETSSAD